MVPCSAVALRRGEQRGADSRFIQRGVELDSVAAGESDHVAPRFQVKISAGDQQVRYPVFQPRLQIDSDSAAIFGGIRDPDRHQNRTTSFSAFLFGDGS